MTTQYIETIGATDPTILRSYGKDARECPHCGRAYAADDVPTIEERCGDDCPQYWELVGKEWID